MQTIYELANEYWNLWLLFCFVAVVGWALWPSRERSEQMKHAANIPLMDDQELTGKGEGNVG